MLDLFLHYTDEMKREHSVLEDDLALFLQEIEICLKTMPDDLWGLPDSIDLNRYVFNKYVTEQEIRNVVETYIIQNCYHAKDFDFLVKPYFEEYNNKEMLIIEFQIKNVNTSENDERMFYMNFILG